MNSRVLLGAYVPVNSVLHRLDPRAKLLICFIFVIDCFYVSNLSTGSILVVILLLTMLASHVSIKNYWNGLKPFVWIIAITVIFQLLFSSGGHVFWTAGPMSVTVGGIVNSVYITYRFIMTILAATVLTATTTSTQLAQAVTWLLTPLKKLKFPVDQFSLMLAISLQFIPILSDEYHRIIEAQISRGADFDGGGWRHIRKLLPILVPLLVSTFNRVSELALAMEARGYVPGTSRTSYRKLAWHARDTWTALFIILLTVLIVLMQIIF